MTTFITFILGAVVGIMIGKAIFRDVPEKYLLVYKTVGDSHRTPYATYESFYFNSKVYPMPLPHMVNEEHFFVPVNKKIPGINKKLPGSVFGRTVIRETSSDGTIRYDYNGYDSIGEKDMQNACKIASFCEIKGSL